LKILFLTDNFPPETNAPATRTYEHAVRWVAAGHGVTVITGAPNFPEGKLYQGYRNRWYAVEEMDGIRVVRVKTYITANEGFVRRTLDYVSFMLSAFFFGLFQPRPDVVVGTSPQFFTVCGAWLLSVCKWRPFVFELRDLWPESIKAVGAMREGLLYRLLTALELFLYRRARLIVCVTGSFKRQLVERGIPADKIAVVRNGVDTAVYAPRPRNEALRREHGLAGKTVVGFLGTLGMAHALGSVLEAARLLGEQGRGDVVFLLAGSGAEREALLQRARGLGLNNVVFLPRQPKSAMPGLWAACDISLITLRDQPLFSTVIPSKIFESMGMGLPIVISIPRGEAVEIVEDSGAGVWVPPEDPEALAGALAALVDDDERMQTYSGASAHAAAGFGRDRLAEEMLRVFKGVLNG
jgi:glycosyltransferase involved in cell wall biosynthesis